MLESLALGDIDTHPYWTLKPSEIWASDERFKEYPKDTVVNSIRRYRKSISLHKKSISFEDDAAAKHIEKFCGQTTNNRGKTKLHNHQAKHLLELDVAAGRTNGRFPKDIQQDRPEYQDFDVKVFGKMVNNERKKQKGEIWYAQRNKAGMLRHIQRRDQQLKEAGLT
jgi:hypothetical protein